MPIRWNSTHAMLDRILELRPAIDAECRYISIFGLLYELEIVTNMYQIRRALTKVSTTCGGMDITTTFERYIRHLC